MNIKNQPEILLCFFFSYFLSVSKSQINLKGLYKQTAPRPEIQIPKSRGGGSLFSTDRQEVDVVTVWTIRMTKL